jgi:hypothetical protein
MPGRLGAEIQECRPLRDFTKSLIQLWTAEGLEIRPGVLPGQLDDFERRHGVRLPEDMRRYFAIVDGMGPRDLDRMDSRQYSFWDLGSLIPVSCETDYPSLERLLPNHREF